MSATDLRTRAARPGPARWLGRVLTIAVLAFFAVFFVLPLAWLLLAPTKTTTQLNGLHGEQPFSFGSFGQLAENWNTLTGFQDGIIWTWLGNSVLYSGVALVITIIVTIPAGYALAMTDFRGRRLLLVTTLIVMLIPNTALVLPIFLELNVARLIDSPWAVILPFAFFPFGVYLTYHLLLHVHLARSPRRGSHRRRGGVPGVLAHRPAPRDPGHRTGRVLQLRRQLEQLLPALHRGAGVARGCPCRWAWRN